MVTDGLRDVHNDAIRYWESRRLIYNMVLTAIVLIYLCSATRVQRILFNRYALLLVFLACSLTLLTARLCVDYFLPKCPVIAIDGWSAADSVHYRIVVCRC